MNGPSTERRLKRLAISASLSLAIVMLVGKSLAAWWTGSIALASDAAESFVHLAATAFAAYSLWRSARPADSSHPFGHGKIAYFSTAFEGALVFATGGGVAFASAQDLLFPRPLHDLGPGLWLASALAVLNLGLGALLLWAGRRSRSLVLESNGHHVLSDVWTSLAVVLGVGLVGLTGWEPLDPLVALGAAGLLFFNGGRLLSRAARGLLEAADPADTARIVETLSEARLAGRIAGYHQVRHRRIDEELWIEAHLLMPGGLSLHEAHRRASAVEAALVAAFGRTPVRVLTHLEPELHEAAHPGGHADFPEPV